MADYSVKKISHGISLWHTFFFGGKRKEREALNISYVDAHFFFTCIKNTKLLTCSCSRIKSRSLGRRVEETYNLYPTIA